MGLSEPSLHRHRDFHQPQWQGHCGRLPATEALDWCPARNGTGAQCAPRYEVRWVQDESDHRTQVCCFGLTTWFIRCIPSSRERILISRDNTGTEEEEKLSNITKK